MIKKALEYIVGLNKPEITEIGGETYTDKELHRVVHNPKADVIYMNTLTSLMDYIVSDTDAMAEKMILHVASPTGVGFYSQLDEDRKREMMVSVAAELPDFKFGHFLPHEEFCIALQSKFMDTEDRKLLLKFAGTVEAGSIAQYSDDGVSQKATVKTGIVGKQDDIVPGGSNLKAIPDILKLGAAGKSVHFPYA